MLFHALTGLFGISLSNVWIAKAISGTVAMANSFYLNRRWVFAAHEGRGLLPGQAVRFVAATLVGVYVIQTGLTQVFASAVDAAKLFDEDFVVRTVAFVLATTFSLGWNFAAYKWWVFRDRR